VDNKYDPKSDTFMGGVMVNLGYITPEQREKADTLDAISKTLQKNNPDFKKPFYGHIAAGDGAEKIMQELQKQIADGKISSDDPLKKKLDQMEGVKSGIAGEKEGSDIERKGGPIDNSLKVQKELRDLERMGMLPDTPEQMRETTRGIADKLGIKTAAADADSQRREAHRDVDFLLHASAESVRPTHVERPEGLRRA